MRTHVRALFGVLAVSVVATLSTGCTQQTSGTDGPLTQLYARLSDSKTHRKEVDLLNYAGLAKMLQVTDQGDLQGLAVKLSETGLGTPIPFAPLLTGATEKWEETYGFPLSGFESVATTGNTFLFGGIATRSVESSLRGNKAFGKQLTHKTSGKRGYFGWAIEDPSVPKPNIAILDEHSVLISTSHNTMKNVLNAKRSEKRLASWNAGYTAVKEAENAGSLFIAIAEGPHIRPPFQPGISSDAALKEAKRRFDPDQFHVPDVAMALGIGKSNGKPALILVYAHAHKDDAKLHATKFKKLIESGSSYLLREDWKGKFTHVSVVSKGKLMIAVSETTRPRVGLDSLAMGDSLV